MKMRASAYTACPSENGGWTRTKLGHPLRYGVVAVDPRVIPLGSMLFIEGYGLALASDTGSAIKGNRIDLLMATKAQAYRFGRRSVTVHVLKRG
jgi:3D (Asp-Asp-Asp) domain-containing protein